ncbi:Uncharacterised protein [Providencia stuartii]|nr:Uncharacterised protein [Providencia stuartii]
MSPYDTDVNHILTRIIAAAIPDNLMWKIWIIQEIEHGVEPKIESTRREKKRDRFPAEKNWKQMYGRRKKIIRATQLGMAYPQISNRQLALKGLEEIHNSK